PIRSAAVIIYVNVIHARRRRRVGVNFRAVSGGDIDVERAAVFAHAAAVEHMLAIGRHHVQVKVGAVGVPRQHHAQPRLRPAGIGIVKLHALALGSDLRAYFDAVGSGTESIRPLERARLVERERHGDAVDYQLGGLLFACVGDAAFDQCGRIVTGGVDGRGGVVHLLAKAGGGTFAEAPAVARGVDLDLGEGSLRE